MTDQALFHGVGVALVTLFEDDGTLSARATADHAGQLVEQGVAGVVVAGTTGEAATLDARERVELIKAVLDVVGGEVPVIAGTGAASARQAIQLTSSARDAGADGALLLSPLWYRDLVQYFGQVSSECEGIPLLAYHFPRFSPPGIPVDVLADLAIAGIKDSSADAGRLTQEILEYHGCVYVGAESLLFLAGQLGGTGAIVGLANLEPALCKQAWEGDIEAQKSVAELHDSLGRDWLTELKVLLAEKYRTSPTTRVA